MELTQIILGVLLFLGTVGSSYLAAMAGIRRAPAQNEFDKAQMNKVAIESTKLLLEPLNQKIIDLEAKAKLDKAEFDRAVEDMKGVYHIEFDLVVGKNPTAAVTWVEKVREKQIIQ